MKKTMLVEFMKMTIYVVFGITLTWNNILYAVLSGVIFL